MRALLYLLFAGMVIAGAIISFQGAFLIPTDTSERAELGLPPLDLSITNPGVGNEIAFVLVLIGSIGLGATFLLKGLVDFGRSGD